MPFFSLPRSFFLRDLHVLLSALLVLSCTVSALPSRFSDGKVYGVNLGSWLLLEPWMLPSEWVSMGGQFLIVDDSTMVLLFDHSDLAQAYPNTVDEIFNKHWTTWFTQQDVNSLVEYGLNTVRIPLGYWIIEPLVNRSTEHYPRGGIKQLKRGLHQLKHAGIDVILDHHALPGVQTPNQQFAGRCTPDVEFYDDYNYHRALVWTAVMTRLIHTDADFNTVYALESVNEPIMDASKTPGYGNFQKNFVQTVRAVEASFGISPKQDHSDEVTRALRDANAIYPEVASELGITNGRAAGLSKPLVTTFMDILWQYDNPPNPADAADGAQAYDDHLYYSFGGVADANEEAYMKSICNLPRAKNDTSLRNAPMWFGEWGLSTQFNATDAFLKTWGDAQKLTYSNSAGWIYWNFKVEKSDAAGDLARQWSYFDGVQRGYLTQDPSQYFNPNVCDPYVN